MRTPWHHEPRQRLSEQEAARLFLEHDGKCWKCGCKIGVTELRRNWTVGHKLALERGGDNSWGNLAPECELCKPIVDAEDHKAAGKQRRVATRHLVCKPMRKRSALSRKHGMKFNWSLGRYEKMNSRQ